MTFLSGVIEGFYGTPWSISERKHLFEWMKNLSMNTYMYAPKDDEKHRDEWRDSYTENECEILRSLIECAKLHQINFVYAISPGLDIVFTSEKDVQLLKEKIEQVYSMGCRSFAILFDDIEPDLCLADKLEFTSSAEAQALLTNRLFKWFDDLEVVLFCPTEYCATRAKPNIESSKYLQVIGEKLDSNIKIFWTGPKVVSESITSTSLENLTKVLRRKPVIWDNIHANDYDDRRVFLGPFKGRPKELYASTVGVLTNPNCGFESNFVAFESLSHWYMTALDENKPYDPDQLLQDVCEKWMKKLLKPQCASDKMSNFKRVKNSLINDTDIVNVNEVAKNEEKQKKKGSTKKNGKDEEIKEFDAKDLEIICHFFYLPYECGDFALEFVNNFKWLKANAFDFKKMPTEFKMDEWRGRSAAFLKQCSNLCGILERFSDLPNEKIVAELDGYLTELKDTINRLKSYVEFLGSKEREKEGGMIPRDPEAWYFRGGLIGQMERLIPMNEEEEITSTSQYKLNIIRPYMPSDMENIYKLCNTIDHIPSKLDHDDLAFDSTIGCLLEFPKSSSFVLEVEDEICGIVIGHTDTKEYYEYYKNEWLPKMREKYKRPSISSTKLTREEECINHLYETPFILEDKFIGNYPGVVGIHILPEFMGNVLTKRALECLLSTLKTKVHIMERAVKRKRKELLQELGFTVLNSSNDFYTVFGYK